MQRHIACYFTSLFLLSIALKILSTHAFVAIIPEEKSQANKANEKGGKSLALLSTDTKLKENKLGQLSVEEYLLVILEENVNFVRGRTVLDDGKLINTFDEFVQAQEDRIYFVEDVLYVNSVNMTEMRRRFPMKYYSNPSLGLSNISRENSTRCKYVTNQLFYTPMKDWQYPVYKMTKMKNTQEFRLPGVGDDDSTENKSFEKVTKTFVIYEKLKALFFNCPVYHECEQLVCRLRNDEEIIAIRLSELMETFNSTKRFLPPGTAVIFKNHTFSVSRLPKKERPLQEATNLTESYQCAFNLSQAVKSRWLRNALVEINGSISSLDTIYETVVKNRSCSKAPISCCGVLCCVVFPQPLTSPKKDADEFSALTTLGGIAAFIGAAAAIGVVLCVANYISLHRTKKADASLDEEDADHPTREEVEQMMADGKLKRVRRGPQLRS